MNKKKWIAFFGIILYLVCSYSVFLFFETKQIRLLTREDGFFQTIGAIFFLISSVIFFLAFLRVNSKNDLYFYQTKKNYFFLILSILFFIGFGEEISWGQRILDIETPEYIQKINKQNEINIHNLEFWNSIDAEGNPKSSLLAKYLSIDRLFSLFWLTFCFIVPILKTYWRQFARVVNRIGLPIVPLYLGFAFVLNYLISKAIEFNVSHELIHPIVEIKECNFGFLFLLVGLYFFQFKSYPVCHQKTTLTTFIQKLSSN